MNKFSLLVTAAAIIGFAGAADAHHGKGSHANGGPKGNAYGHGCSSPGAEEGSPGQWFTALNEHPYFGGEEERMNPKQMAEKEYNDSSATPRDLMEEFCGPN